MKRNLVRWSTIEGFLYALMVGTTESYALFYVVKSGISVSELAWLSTLPILLGALAQWLLPLVSRKRATSQILVGCLALQVAGLSLLVASTALGWGFSWILKSMCLYWIGGMGAGPFWLSWFDKQVPQAEFRSTLAKRNGLVALATLFAYLGTSLVIADRSDREIYAAVFAVGASARLGCLFLQCLLSFRPECLPKLSFSLTPNTQMIPVQPAPEDELPSRDFKTEVIVMIAATVLFKMMANIASPFFLPYMVQSLEYSLQEYTLLTAIPFFGRFVFLAGWGRASVGLRPFNGLVIASFGIALVPALWASVQNYWFYAVLELASGMLWGGFELCAVLIVQRCWPSASLSVFGLHMALMNLGALVGAQIGVWAMQSSSYQQLFYFSSTMRLAVVVIMLAAFRAMPATRTKWRVFGEYLVTVLSLRPSLSNVGRMIWIKRDS